MPEPNQGVQSRDKEVQKKEDANKVAGPENAALQTPARGGKDLGKVALFVSILAVVLLFVFFYGLSRNMSGLAREFDELQEEKARLAALGDRLEELEAGYKERIESETATIKATLRNMDSRFSLKFEEMESQRAELVKGLAQLQDLPGEMQRLVLSGLLRDLSLRLMYVSSRTPEEEQNAKLMEALALMGEVLNDMEEDGPEQ